MGMKPGKSGGSRTRRVFGAAPGLPRCGVVPVPVREPLQRQRGLQGLYSPGTAEQRGGGGFGESRVTWTVGAGEDGGRVRAVDPMGSTLWPWWPWDAAGAHPRAPAEPLAEPPGQRVAGCWGTFICSLLIWLNFFYDLRLCFAVVFPGVVLRPVCPSRTEDRVMGWGPLPAVSVMVCETLATINPSSKAPAWRGLALPSGGHRLAGKGRMFLWQFLCNLG